MTLRPTHHCFDDALDFIVTLMDEGMAPRQLKTYTVVHGICAADDGEFSHAWVEHDDLVIQRGIENEQYVWYTLPIGEFYEVFRVRRTTKYTALEALTKNAMTGHLGPWEPEYRALCGANGERRVMFEFGLEKIGEFDTRIDRMVRGDTTDDE